jgi:uncharacterized YccA/Bax inhibitor family protein
MSNPYLTKTFEEVGHSNGNVMTVGGAVQKTIMLAMILFVLMGVSWYELGQDGLFFGINPTMALLGSGVLGLVTILAATFVKSIVVPAAFIYAVLEGVFLGVLTFIVNGLYPGLPLIAGGATATTMVGVLILYQLGILRATPAFIKIVIGATVGLLLFVGFTFLLSLFGMTGIRETIYGSGPIGIGFSLFCVGLAALNLVIDFHVIEQGAEQRAPKRMEWHAALGLLVTLIWLYVEILRLLMKLQSRD